MASLSRDAECLLELSREIADLSHDLGSLICESLRHFFAHFRLELDQFGRRDDQRQMIVYVMPQRRKFAIEFRNFFGAERYRVGWQTHKRGSTVLFLESSMLLLIGNVGHPFGGTTGC